MSTRANQQNKAAATKRTASRTQGARGDNKIVSVSDETPRRRSTDAPGNQEQKYGRRSTDRKPEASMPQAAEDAARKSTRRQSAGRNGKTPATIGALVCKLLAKNKSTDEILKTVAEKFPGAKTSRASVSWYRSKVAKQGKS